MRFTDFAGVSKGPQDDWYDPILTEDTPLYVDPLLVFEDPAEFFADSRDMVLRFFETCLGLIRGDAGQMTTRQWAKVKRLLVFPEPKEFALGLTMGSPIGAGTGDHFATQMAEALEAIQQAIESGVDYVESFALFVPGIGVDRISDIFCNILKSQFILYTQEVCKRHQIATELLPVRHASWSPISARWVDQRVELPRSPFTGDGVLLTPERFLQNIPQRITAHGFYRWAETNAGAVLRDDLNYDLAKALNQSVRAERGRILATRRPDIAFGYVEEVIQAANAAPYDVENDPELLVRWFEAGRAAGASEVRNSALLRQPDRDGLHKWVGELIDRFRHSVENTDLWRTFWNHDMRRPRQEKIVQAVAGQLWAVQCEASNVDISREANVGRGPVDFKFSAGWHGRVLLEVKLMSSKKLQKGASAQLPQYMRSERISSAYYACVGFTDNELSDDRTGLVRQTCAAYERQSGYRVTPHFIDARPKASASKL